VEIPIYKTSTKRSPNRAPFGKISKSGDGGDGGGSFGTKKDSSEYGAPNGILSIIVKILL
jgi:hypothetical protein